MWVSPHSLLDMADLLSSYKIIVIVVVDRQVGELDNWKARMAKERPMTRDAGHSAKGGQPKGLDL